MPREHLSRSEGRRRFATRVEDRLVGGNSSDSLVSAAVSTSSESAEAQSDSTNSPGGSGSPSPSDSPTIGDATNKKPLAAVKSAIADFQVISGLTLRLPTDKETSYIYKWGVCVEMVEDGKPVHHWICLADDTRRKQGTNFTLSSGRTSNAASHLASVHGVVSRRMQAYKTEKA
ncbi:hypothetical protein PHYSODRAFT_306189 [Phytophthora sojae]|uniref:Uncharacterized protein n=1 Tax=Phytophthora sojae (strain P6497) TaxID=1094619 RepID=G5A8B1_PHYSP|nr:hypothetical protein PHYSODRAFT_306189 [Phytophthora sojae]EGZ08137.1 hypothetical protein PHYSODRAFT_306189 [Phytophthora sojae]|eukprot:XP_009536309.1 hypothetical protein PHYSODRAFT_306189 [Phytophthora sojae]